MCFLAYGLRSFGVAEVSPQLRFQSLMRSVSQNTLVLSRDAKGRRDLLERVTVNVPQKPYFGLPLGESTPSPPDLV
jgi:hypothetical protein